MKSQLWAASAMVALAAVLGVAPQSSAKPGDLPAQNGFEFANASDDPVTQEFSIELGIGTNGITLKFGAGAAKPTTPPPAIDTVLPMFLDHCCSHLGDMLAQPNRFFSVDALLSRLPQLGGNGKAPCAPKAPRSVETRLFDTVNVKIKDVPLKQALKNLAHVSGVAIVPNTADLNDARVDLDRPVSLVVENTSLYTALQQLLQPLKLTFEIENGIVTVTVPEKGSSTPAARVQRTRNEAAQRLFEMAERHRRAGDYAVARTLYQQVHLLTPTTLHGRVAIGRIAEVEERMRDTAEEEDVPGRTADPEQVYRDIRNRTIPLGLVEVSY